MITLIVLLGVVPIIAIVVFSRVGRGSSSLEPWGDKDHDCGDYGGGDSGGGGDD